ncbi:MAG TPA: glycosyl hydrolase family 28-related protein [Myxococcales bacterium]|nr:glycosyl hydrolase family 28-related protein [Myxococcales bacterium]
MNRFAILLALGAAACSQPPGSSTSAGSSGTTSAAAPTSGSSTGGRGSAASGGSTGGHGSATSGASTGSHSSGATGTAGTTGRVGTSGGSTTGSTGGATAGSSGGATSVAVLPSGDGVNCVQNPGECRSIPWEAGSDLWNGGVLPSYPPTTCAGLHADGTTDDGPAIQACIDAAPTGTAVVLPAATYLIDTPVQIASQVALRGAGMGQTILVVGQSFMAGQANQYSSPLETQSFETDGDGTIAADGSVQTGGTNIYPSPTWMQPSNGYLLSGSPLKGDTTVTLTNAADFTALSAFFGKHNGAMWVSVFGDDDPGLVSGSSGDFLSGDTTDFDGDFCYYCGDNNGWHFMQQLVPVASFDPASRSITLGRPLYFDLYRDPTSKTYGQLYPGTSWPTTAVEGGPQLRVYDMQTIEGGFEDLTLDGSQANVGGSPLVNIEGCAYCWVKGVETINAGGDSGSSHIQLTASYGAEVRDCYVHDGYSNASGADYGIYLYNVNSDHKIENDVMRHNRHSLINQGGGSGICALYNYIDDDYTDDQSYLAGARANHGAHPFMNLFEGNVASHIAADDYHGTSSHDVFFRNWLWGDETGDWTGVNPASLQNIIDGSSTTVDAPTWGFYGVDVYDENSYYAFVGNVLGRPLSQSTYLHVDWSSAIPEVTAANAATDCWATPPTVYTYGCHSGNADGFQTTPLSTSINYGNYDYQSLTSAASIPGDYESGQPLGSPQPLPDSLYYSSKPAFFGTCTWPPIDAASGTTVSIPAELRYEGQSCP